MWCTPTSGMSFAKLMAFASATPTSSAPTRPGPYVTPMASKSSRVTSASFNASSMTWLIFSMCFLEAISGTTPPYNLCSSIWDDMILDNMVLPFFTTEAAVSSQELSIARISTSSFFFSILHSPFSQNSPAMPGMPYDSSSNCSSTDCLSRAAIVLGNTFAASGRASSGRTRDGL